AAAAAASFGRPEARRAQPRTQNDWQSPADIPAALPRARLCFPPCELWCLLWLPGSLLDLPKGRCFAALPQAAHGTGYWAGLLVSLVTNICPSAFRGKPFIIVLIHGRAAFRRETPTMRPRWLGTDWTSRGSLSFASRRRRAKAPSSRVSAGT